MKHKSESSSFLKIIPLLKEVSPPDELKQHEYEIQSTFKLKEDNPLQINSYNQLNFPSLSGIKQKYKEILILFVLWTVKLHILHSENVPFLVANAVSLLFIPSILLFLPMQDMTLMVAKVSPISFPSLLIKLNFNELFLSAQGVSILDFTFFTGSRSNWPI